MEQVDLCGELLLISFGISKMHGKQTEHNVPTIRDGRMDSVNGCAWMPQQMQYDHLLEALHCVWKYSADSSLVQRISTDVSEITPPFYVDDAL